MRPEPAPDRGPGPVAARALRVVPDGPAAVLAGCDWLVGADPVVLAALAAAGTVVELARREELVGVGHAGDRVVVLLRGRLAAAHDTGRGVTTWLCVAHDPLTTLGLENVLTGQAHLAALCALDEPATVLTLPAGAVRAALLAQPALGLAVAEHLARRVQQVAELAVDLAVLDVRRRVAKYLALRVDAGGRTPGLRQHDLARRLGASRQSVNAATSSFVRRGWLAPPGPDGSHRVLDRAALARCAGVDLPTTATLLH